MGSMIEVVDVEKAFGKLDVLKGISFSIKPGEIVGLIGSSGSGKSTILRCINGLERFHKGDVLINGNSILEDKSQVYQTGMVFQNFNLFPHYTVLENITKPCVTVKKMSPDNAKEKALALLKKVQLSDKISQYPATLSGGQQQRLAIARALSMEPKIMLFDEPTSALDPELVQEVLKTMKDLVADGLTMIIVSHQMNMLKSLAGRIIYLNQGVVEESGSTSEILNNPQNPNLQNFLSKIEIAK